MASISHIPLALPQPTPALELVAYLHGRKQRFFVPPAGTLCVGRSVECEVRLNHNSVSRRHLVIRAHSDGLFIEDLGSRNGTRLFHHETEGQDTRPEETHGSVREWRVEAHAPRRIEVGDMLRVGSVMIRLEVPRFDRQDSPEEEFAVFEDPRSREVFSLAERVAKSDISVLILGETGVGKDVLAHAIHRASSRKNRPFVRIHCAALAESLLESELFGHVKGAFTGAIGNEGLIESANGGTVFLDELGEMPLSTQVKLLNVLETGEVLRVGATRPKKVDVRFIAATNRDLPRSIVDGTFRNDLYFRVAGITLDIPPLRKRPRDIEPLAFRFAEKAAERAGLSTPPEISPSCMDRLLSWRYPGNVRELKNIIDRAVLLCSGTVIEETDLIIEHSALAPESVQPEAEPLTLKRPETWTPFSRHNVDSGPLAEQSPHIDNALPEETQERAILKTKDTDVESSPEADKRDRIKHALIQCSGNQTRAAALLGVSRRTLINWMEDLDMPRPRKGA